MISTLASNHPVQGVKEAGIPVLGALFNFFYQSPPFRVLGRPLPSAELESPCSKLLQPVPPLSLS